MGNSWGFNYIVSQKEFIVVAPLKEYFNVLLACHYENRVDPSLICYLNSNKSKFALQVFIILQYYIIYYLIL